MRKYTISIQLLSQYKDNIQNCCSVWYYLPIIIKSDILLSESEVLYEKKNRRPGKFIKRKEKIKWSQEIRTAFFTSILFLLFTTFTFWIAHNVSPGEFIGQKLEQYFVKNIAKELDLSYRTANIDFEQELVFLPQRSGLDDALVICGTYYTDMEYPTGRFISIWERKNRSFWNELFGAKESYEIVFIRACEDQNNNSYTLMCHAAILKM